MRADKLITRTVLRGGASLETRCHVVTFPRPTSHIFPTLHDRRATFLAAHTTDESHFSLRLSTDEPLFTPNVSTYEPHFLAFSNIRGLKTAHNARGRRITPTALRHPHRPTSHIFGFLPNDRRATFFASLTTNRPHFLDPRATFFIATHDRRATQTRPTSHITFRNSRFTRTNLDRNSLILVSIKRTNNACCCPFRNYA